jgi:hypothetical protein
MIAVQCLTFCIFGQKIWKSIYLILDDYYLFHLFCLWSDPVVVKFLDADGDGQVEQHIVARLYLQPDIPCRGCRCCCLPQSAPFMICARVVSCVVCIPTPLIRVRPLVNFDATTPSACNVASLPNEAPLCSITAMPKVSNHLCVRVCACVRVVGRVRVVVPAPSASAISWPNTPSNLADPCTRVVSVIGHIIITIRGGGW